MIDFLDSNLIKKNILSVIILVCEIIQFYKFCVFFLKLDETIMVCHRSLRRNFLTLIKQIGLI